MVSRRTALAGGAAIAAGSAVAGCAGGGGNTAPGGPGWEAIVASDVIGQRTEPFYGTHQAGITTAPQSYAAFVAFTIDDGASPADIAGVLRAWSQDSARLTSGGGALADLEPELAVHPARLTVTIGLGPDFFDAVGLPHKRPEWLAQLPAFPQIDKLESRWSGGDLLLQICADDPMTVSHAVRVLAAGVRGVAHQKWVQRGFRRAVGTSPAGHTQRNLLGQLDGTVNPSPADADFDRLLFSDGSDQQWMTGGSSLVLRRIRMDIDDWEKIDRHSRELTMGRTLDTGAPLTGHAEHDPADFMALDERGLPVIPEESHMARARPRQREEVILRRPYNYDDAPERGQLSNSGLLFTAYQANPVEQFLPIQQRLAAKDALNVWTIPIGSAVFALPPGAAQGEFVGQTLFDSGR